MIKTNACLESFNSKTPEQTHETLIDFPQMFKDCSTYFTEGTVESQTDQMINKKQNTPQN